MDLNVVANRISYLHSITRDDPDETPIEQDSLRQFYRFALSEQHLPHPRIGAGPRGLIQIEWDVVGGGILAMEFPSDGTIVFAGIFGHVGQEDKIKRIRGTLDPDDMMKALKPFIHRLKSE